MHLDQPRNQDGSHAIWQLRLILTGAIRVCFHKLLSILHVASAILSDFGHLLGVIHVIFIAFWQLLEETDFLQQRMHAILVDVLHSEILQIADGDSTTIR